MEEPTVFIFRVEDISDYVALHPRRQESSVTVVRTLNLAIVGLFVLLNSVILTSGYAVLNGVRL
jgi:hypothetical protein